MTPSRKLLAIALTVGLSMGISPSGHAQGAEPSAPNRGWSMADQYWGAEEMAKSRAAIQKEHGGMKAYYVQADRFEYRTGEGDPHLLWDVQGWYGGDKDKLWIKIEGKYAIEGDAFEGAEVQALWSHAISRYFDAQAGVRHDFAPGDDRTFGVLGVQGLAPYWFEVDAAAFISDDGDVSARVEIEYELLLTQRLILQPRTELNFAIQDVPESGIGSGLSSAEVGLRLRYEIKREFAPYVGVSLERAVGETADFARADGEDPSAVSFVAGLRLWF
ncbi:MAG: copper resistance protein B [Hyphococcus sp.]|nr:MAG: copper resistance protein B [Marinicaulis sp.]